jgi:hypothetical protein
MSTSTTLEKTIQTWQPYYEQELTQRDAEEIVSNWSAYIDLLSQWTAILQERGEGA